VEKCICAYLYNSGFLHPTKRKAAPPGRHEYNRPLKNGYTTKIQGSRQTSGPKFPHFSTHTKSEKEAPLPATPAWVAVREGGRASTF